MPLSGSLLHVDLTFACPFCNRAVVKSGGWFKAVSSFECEGCRREVRLTYPDKLGIFEKYAHLA